MGVYRNPLADLPIVVKHFDEMYGSWRKNQLYARLGKQSTWPEPWDRPKTR